jgi:hypothetical protein
MGGRTQRGREGDVRELEERGETIGGLRVMAPPFLLQCAQTAHDFGIHVIGLPVAAAWIRRARISGDGPDATSNDHPANSRSERTITKCVT